MSLDDVFRKIEADHENAISALEDLVAIPSVSAENEGLQCADHLLSLIKNEIGFLTRKISTSGYPVVYAERHVGAKTSIIFYNHYDVQDPAPLNKWTSPPFQLTRHKNQLFGRGVSDTKGNIIARIFAIKAYQSIFQELPVNIKFVIEGQEEVGSPYLHEFINSHPELVEGSFCIWESGHRNADGAQQIWLGVKGILYLTIEVVGPKRDIHSSWGGVVENPAWELVRLLNSLKAPSGQILIDGFYDAVQPPTDHELIQLNSIPFDQKAYLEDFGIEKFEKTEPELKKIRYYSPILNINGLDSGYQGPGAKTILPAKAQAKIEFRLVPNQDPPDILQRFQRHLQDNNFGNVRILSHHGYPSARTPLNSPYLQLIRDAGQLVYGRPVIVHPSKSGSGPMHLFINKMDCFAFGCGHPQSRNHAPNENIFIADLLLNMKHFAAIFHSLRVKSFGVINERI